MGHVTHRVGLEHSRVSLRSPYGAEKSKIRCIFYVFVVLGAGAITAYVLWRRSDLSGGNVKMPDHLNGGQRPTSIVVVADISATLQRRWPNAGGGGNDSGYRGYPICGKKIIT